VFAGSQLVLGLAQIGNAALAEAGLGADALVHAAPQVQRFDGERDLARIAAHLPAPAPVAARLLGADLALLAQHHVDAAFAQFERRAGADDAAADDHDAGALRDGVVADDGIGSWCHVAGAPDGAGRRARRHLLAGAGGDFHASEASLRGWAFWYWAIRCSRSTEV
jgi:hypothetical protein